MKRRITRRTFTRAGATATIGLAATSKASARAAKPLGANERVRLGFIGVGNRGGQLLTAFLEQKYHIHVRPRFVDGEFTFIRVTPNVFSTLEEVDLFTKGIEDAVRNGVSV